MTIGTNKSELKFYENQLEVLYINFKYIEVAATIGLFFAVGCLGNVLERGIFNGHGFTFILGIIAFLPHHFRYKKIKHCRNQIDKIKNENFAA